MFSLGTRVLYTKNLSDEKADNQQVISKLHLMILAKAFPSNPIAVLPEYFVYSGIIAAQEEHFQRFPFVFSSRLSLFLLQCIIKAFLICCEKACHMVEKSMPELPESHCQMLFPFILQGAGDSLPRQIRDNGIFVFICVLQTRCFVNFPLSRIAFFAGFR